MNKFDLSEYLQNKYGIPEEQDMTTWGLYYTEIVDLLDNVHLYYLKKENKE